MFHKILVPVDGSSSSEQGLDEAIVLARESRGELVLLHVLESIPLGMEMATADTWRTVLDSLRTQGQAVLDAASRKATAQGVRVSTQLEEFPALRVADVILKVAQDRSCDLIAMGTHGRRGFSHLMLGSDAERVVRASPGPVLLVRQRQPPQA
jgi:nucleotide-binding universal stress UspA family protein